MDLIDTEEKIKERYENYTSKCVISESLRRRFDEAFDKLLDDLEADAGSCHQFRKQLLQKRAAQFHAMHTIGLIAELIDKAIRTLNRNQLVKIFLAKGPNAETARKRQLRKNDINRKAEAARNVFADIDFSKVGISGAGPENLRADLENQNIIDERQ